jgi:hypothetical protein
MPVPAGPFDPTKLHCELLLPRASAQGLLGFAPQLLERLSRRDDGTALVCTHRTQRLDETFSFQVTCGQKEVPPSFEALRRVHLGAGGAHPMALGKRGIATRTSCLFVHPHRPCFIQVVGQAARANGSLEKIAAQIAAALP